MESCFEVQAGVHVLPAYVAVPTFGLVPVNAYLVDAQQPYLVDAGLIADERAFVDAIRSVLDPARLRWIYLTNADSAHVGALRALLELAPEAKLVTTFRGLTKLDLARQLVSPKRVRLANPGERIDLGDRTLTVLPAPLFDAPETTMLHDSLLDALFSSDTFGGMLKDKARLANDLSEDELAPAALLWTAINFPWIHRVDRHAFDDSIRELMDLDPDWIFATHLPPARRMAHALCQILLKAPEAPRFASPDQRAFEAMLRASSTSPPRT